MKLKYRDNVLIKLRRIYGKDEYVSALLKKVSELEFETGVLKSEVSEIDHFRSVGKKMDRLTRINADLISKNKTQVEDNRLLRIEIAHLKSDNEDLISENQSLISKYL